MKAIVLASGSATRLNRVTQMVSKRRLPVCGKPMFYYPLSIPMLAGIREVLVISTSEDSPRLHQLPGDGAHWRVSLSYAVQPSADAIARAFLIVSGSCVPVLEEQVY